MKINSLIKVALSRMTLLSASKLSGLKRDIAYNRSTLLKKKIKEVFDGSIEPTNVRKEVTISRLNDLKNIADNRSSHYGVLEANLSQAAAKTNNPLRKPIGNTLKTYKN